MAMMLGKQENKQKTFSKNKNFASNDFLESDFFLTLFVKVPDNTFSLVLSIWRVCTTRIQAPVILFFLSAVFLVPLLFKLELITDIKSIEELGMDTLKDKRVQYGIGTN